MLRLHDSASSGNAYKVRLLLTQLGIPFERIEYDTDHGATRTSEFLSTINANGRVPVLELDDGRCLPESNAILWYLAEGTPYLPGADGHGEDGRWQRAQVLQWMFFEQYSHEPYVATPRYICRHFAADHPRRAELPDRLAKGRAAFAVMEQHLSTRQFFVNERYSIADIALYAYTHVAEDGGHDLEPCPHLREWLGRVAAQPNHVTLLARPK
jgi:glutathione S-transferase